MRLLSVKPGIYVPTLYFIEGLPYTMVTMMSVVMFKNLGADNGYIGLVTSFITLPWVLKPIWSPVVDLFGTRRAWVLVAHMVLAVMSVILAIAAFATSEPISIANMSVPLVVVIATGIFSLMAIVSATQDIAIDGFYMDVLSKEQQALFVGFRQAAYKVAWLTGTGLIVMLVGFVAEKCGFGFHYGWCVAFSVCAALYLVATLFHWVGLPKPDQAHASVDPKDSAAMQLKTQFKQVFATFFSQKGAIAIVAYILTFRLGDALMLKMTVPFLLDKQIAGGMEMSTETEGLIYGTVGMVALLAGGIFGSWVLSRFGLKRCLMPAAIFQSAAIPLYWMLAVLRPAVPVVAGVNAFEQFSYGVGSAAYTVYLMSTVKPEFRASHYAIATGLMALGLMIPGAISGYLTKLGYPTFFLISFATSIPGIITILFLPFKEADKEQEAEYGVPQTGEMGH